MNKYDLFKFSEMNFGNHCSVRFTYPYFEHSLFSKILQKMQPHNDGLLFFIINCDLNSSLLLCRWRRVPGRRSAVSVRHADVPADAAAHASYS